jgi:hypothetical protein
MAKDAGSDEALTNTSQQWTDIQFISSILETSSAHGRIENRQGATG